MGKTIIISSHILSELQSLCNRVAIIERGKLIYSGPVQGVKNQMETSLIVWVKVGTDPDKAIGFLKTRSEVSEAEIVEDNIRITMASHDADVSVIAETLVKNGIPIHGLKEEELGLEEVFMRMTRGETQ